MKLADGRELTLRAVRVSDASEIHQAFERLSPASRLTRFLHHKKSLSAEMVERGVRPRPGYSFVLVATVPADDGIDIVGAAQYQPLGVAGEQDRPPGEDARGEEGVANDARPASCEFAITVAEDWRGSGLARRLLASLVDRARRDGYTTIEGLVSAENVAMLALARRLKFTPHYSPEGGNAVVVRRRLVRD
ncbi:MAG: GNAT family N-acetyltransferase [Burkholderiaceae bacterium]|nr:GNAT family N-acetyltransferase [Burkholderiaceae bacterium]